MGSEDAEMHVVDDTGFQVDFNSTGWGRNMRTVLLSISAAVWPTDSVAEHRKFSTDPWCWKTGGILPLGDSPTCLAKGMHIMLFLPLAFQRTAGYWCRSIQAVQDEG